MVLLKKHALVVLGALASSAVCANEDAPPAQEAQSRPAIAVQELVTKSGIKIWLYEDHRTPIVALKIRFAGLGSAYEPDDKKGLMEVLTRTICDGAGKLSKIDLKKCLLNLGVELSFAASDDDMFCRVMAFKDSLSKAVDVIKDVIINPTFDNKLVKIAVNQLCDEYKSLIENPKYLAKRAVGESVFPEHPYGRLPTDETYKRVSGNVLRKFWSSALNAQNIFVVLVGNINAKETVNLVDRLFADVPSGGKRKTLARAVPKCSSDLKIVHNDTKQSIIAFYTDGIPPNHPDYVAYQAANLILGGPYQCSRLAKKIRDSEGLVYYVMTSIKNYANANVLVGIGETANKTAYTVVNMIKDVAYKLRFDASKKDNSRIEEEELALAKGQLLKDFYNAFSNCRTLAAYLMNLHVAQLSLSCLYEYPNKVRSLTLQDIQNVFNKKLIDPDKITCIIVGQPEVATPTLQAKP
ncbi:MAG: insulinase family protein [Holosporales bacterium]|jgi:zinc protease|nr:insulinase family protein [Holosporales bacterium]